MSWDAARAVLETHLLALSGVDPASIQWPMRPTPANLRFKVDLIPSRAWAPWGRGAGMRLRGIFQVTVFDSDIQHGAMEITRLVDSVVAHFDRRTFSGSLVVETGTPTPGPLQPEPDMVGCPISIPFETR